MLLKGLERRAATPLSGASIGSSRRRPRAECAWHMRSPTVLDSREFARMTRAIEFIEREYQRQPKLAQIAKHVGLSEFHFNRLFRRWTGLTPKQYLAEVTSRAARNALQIRAVGPRRRAFCRTLGRRASARSDSDARSDDPGRNSRRGRGRHHPPRRGAIRRSEPPSSPRRRAVYVASHSSTASPIAASSQSLRAAWPKAQIRARRRARYDFGRHHLGSRNRQPCRSPCAGPTSRCRSGARCSN